MIYRIVHNTTYEYATAAEACHNVVRLVPRETAMQHVLSTHLDLQPEPLRRHAYGDFFGNSVCGFAVFEPHEKLSITAESRVQLGRPAVVAMDKSPAWNEVRATLRRDRDDATIDALQFVFDSVYVRTSASLRMYAAPSFPAGRPYLEAVHELTSRIHKEFKYDTTATTIDTSIDDVLVRRGGVCQDFAQLQIGCLRSLGLAARYVSGYVHTGRGDGESRMLGADASHAWISVFCPLHGWVDFDPTNGIRVADAHITLGWGRDFHDVSPVKGVSLGGSGARLSVAVTVTREKPASLKTA